MCTCRFGAASSLSVVPPAAQLFLSDPLSFPKFTASHPKSSSLLIFSLCSAATLVFYKIRVAQTVREAAKSQRIAERLNPETTVLKRQGRRRVTRKETRCKSFIGAFEVLVGVHYERYL